LRPLTLAVLVIGLLLGPGYFLYARHLTGAVVGTYPVATAAGGRLEPVLLSLSPDMSPVRLILRVSADHGPSYTGAPTAAPRNRYRAAVTREGQVVAESVFELVANTLESSFQEFAEVLATLRIDAPGAYGVQIEETGKPQMRVTAASLELRRNARDPNMRLVWAGAALLGAGLLALLFAR
jgi:hypothetical protein